MLASYVRTKSVARLAYPLRRSTSRFRKNPYVAMGARLPSRSCAAIQTAVIARELPRVASHLAEHAERRAVAAHSVAVADALIELARRPSAYWNTIAAASHDRSRTADDVPTR
jgi:hypothetical protein